jgi:putative transposase
MDETYIKIKGRWHYLYRAIDADGLTLDIWLRKKRDTQAAYAFLKRLHKQFGQPRVIVTDKAPSIGLHLESYRVTVYIPRQSIEQ